MIIDLTHMPSGGRYEDRYGEYLKVFHQIAMAPIDEKVLVKSPPYSWVPLLWHLGCTFSAPQKYFQHCDLIKTIIEGDTHPIGFFDRTSVEVLCGFRPETVDALWKCDWQWKTPRARKYPLEKEFIVTNNGSFHRQEVADYLYLLNKYVPEKRNVVLVPCAADKPYPSEMHAAVMKMLPPDWYMMNATGVVGLVPSDLWADMPFYDSGIPNEWRLFNIARAYFAKFVHKNVIVYCDYYNLTLYHAFQSIAGKGTANVTYLNELKFFPDYINLLEPFRLKLLKAAIDQIQEKL